MLSKKTIDQKIIHIIKNIRNEFPELLKYIDEMPVNICQNAKHGVHAMELVEYHNSLAELYNGYARKNEGINQIQNKQLSLFYPIYPASDDIYVKGRHETDADPENVHQNKAPNEKEGLMNELSFENDKSGKDLDIPGSELDDEQESTGSEDEENNYYS